MLSHVVKKINIKKIKNTHYVAWRERNALGKELRKLPPLKIICKLYVRLVPECTLLVPQD